MDFVITFQSSHQAIKAERKFMKNHKIDLIPTPREISSECGFSLKISETELSAILDLLNEQSLKYANIYSLTVHKGEKRYEENN